MTRVELDDRAQGSMVGQVIDAFFEGTDHVWSDQRDVGLPVSHGITYVTGPSGCGKSAMLRAVLERDATWTVLPELPDGIALVDQFAGSLGERIAFLAQFGLGDAQVLIRETSWLSDGQRFRARVAAAIQSGATRIAIDEFLSTVDRTSAAIVAHNVQRSCRRAGIDLLVATAHDDLTNALDPDVVVRVRANAAPTHEARTPGDAWELRARVQIGQGTLDDYRDLERFHYYPTLDFDADARDVSVVTATFDGEPVAARLYCAPYPREWADDLGQFAEINRRLTLGQRLVVHPAFRGMGLARDVTAAEHAPRSVIYTRSVMSRFTDMHSALGYAKHEPLTNALLGRSSGQAERDSCRVLAAEYADYETVVTGTASPADVARVAAWFSSRLSGLGDEQERAAGSVTRMGGYVLVKNDPQEERIDR